ncbi:hypothetical protein [Actinophytocola sp.]|uniref:hypothetical protein n=1 Tax=Actinophytocola sp. TaxID=1872138 RepID=UPI002ED44AD4
MRRLKAAMAVLLGAVTLLLAPVGVASADDNGNGLPLCSPEEICFWYNESNILEKQFYWNSGHGGYNFMGVSNGNYYVSDEPLQNNARDITNKDSECTVFVGIWHGNGNWTWESFPNDQNRYFLRTVNNRNDYHQRCGV